MRNISLSLRVKALLLVGLAFAVFLAILAYRATAERQLRLEIARHGVMHNAQLIAAQENRAIDRARQFLESLIASEKRREALFSEEWQRTLPQRLKEEPQIDNILAALPDGRVVCAATPDAGLVGTNGINIADRPNFRRALASSAVVVGEAVKGPNKGKQILPLLKAVRDSNGRMLGVIGVSLDLSVFAGAVDNAKPPSGASIGLIDAMGRVLARQPDPEGWVGKNASNTAFFKAAAAHGGKDAFEDVGFDGVPRMYGVARFADTAAGPIWLWYGVAENAVAAGAKRDFEMTAFALGVLLLASFAAIWAGGERLLLRPLSRLSAAAQRMGEGDLSARTGLRHARDELGRLAQSFDDMAGSLEARSHDVVLANRAVKVLAAWNQALLTPRDEPSLVEFMCRAIVDAGGYRGAWVGFARSDENKTVEPVASWGIDPEFVSNLGVTWSDTSRGRGPAGLAIRSGAAAITNDYMTGADTAPWREYALRHQLMSVISLPLKLDGAVIGALTIQAAESESFGEQEAVLLGEVAAALSSGIAAVRARAARANLEASLQSSEERFHAAAEASLDALIVLKSVRDAAGNLVDFETADLNSCAARQLGRTKDELLGKTYFELAPIHGLAGFFGKYVQVVETRTPLEEEFPFDLPGAPRKWFRQQVVAVGDGVAISLRDITAWKTAGDKIREGEERLRLAMIGAHMGAWSAELESGTYTLSEEIGPIFGLPKGAGPGSPRALLEAVHPDDREALARGLKRDRTTEHSMHREFRVLWPDGSVHWVESYSNAICDETGKPVRSVGVLADITQRKLDVLALERANRALKTLSAGNEALVHAASESELLHAVCDAIVDKGGYRMAWVAYAQNDPAKTIVPVGWAGVEEADVARIKLTWADNEQGQGPVARVLRGGKVERTANVPADPRFAPVRDLLERPGFAANLALPLRDGEAVIGALSIFSGEFDAFDEGEVHLLQELADDLAYGITTLRTREERDRIAYAHEHHEAILRKSLEDSIEAIAATVEMRDPYTSGHQKRVAELAVAIAGEMGLNEERIRGLHLASVIHDLGKISVPAEILAKPGKLTSIEFQLIQGHAQAGYEILKEVDFPWPIATIVRQHHERLDGTGYPQGLKGEDILLESRIMAVADVVEAMASHRPYRATLGIDVALQEIERGRGIKYDATVADACLKLFREGRYVLAA